MKVIPNDAKYKINKGVVYDSHGTRNSYSMIVTEFQQFVETVRFFVDMLMRREPVKLTYRKLKQYL